jgi:hypothetical protein
MSPSTEEKSGIPKLPVNTSKSQTNDPQISMQPVPLTVVQDAGADIDIKDIKLEEKIFSIFVPEDLYAGTYKGVKVLVRKLVEVKRKCCYTYNL